MAPWRSAVTRSMLASRWDLEPFAASTSRLTSLGDIDQRRMGGNFSAVQLRQWPDEVGA